MSLHRHAAKRDDAEGAIVATWAAMGAHSEAISGKGLPDRLVFWKNAVMLAETKSGKRGLTSAQVKKFSELHRKSICVWVVRTAEEARRMLTSLHAPWTPEQGALAGAEVKQRKHRPGHSRARTLAENCRTRYCPLSRLPGREVCAKHEGKP